MTPDSPQMFGIALMALWGTAGAVAVGRAMAKSPAARELLAAVRKMNLAAKGALVAGLVCAVAVGGTKPGGTNDPPRGLRSPPAAVAVEPSFAPVEVSTNAVALRMESASAVEVPDWRKHGSSTGGVWLDFDEPFFRVGTNPVSRAYVAAGGSISFESMQRPPVGAQLPDGSGRPALAPLLAPLGMVPEANWTNAGASSRFWHDAAPGRGRVFTWEAALLDREPGRRVSVQAELHPSGDFTCRYDFHDALDPPATNLVLGAQAGTNGVNALAILGTNILSAPVWRIDGTTATNGIPIADLLCTNGILRTPARFAIKWKNTSGVDLNADADGDGISDWDEVFRHGTDPNHADTDGDGLSDASEILAGANPLNVDENNDGIPDGVDPTAWAANPLWVANTTNTATAITITLNAAIPVGASASLLVDNLCIPLRLPGSWTLALEPGELYTYRLHTYGAPADLSITPATNAPPQRSGPPLRSMPAPFPFWTNDPDGVFDGPSNGGEGEMAAPTLELAWIDPGDGSHENNGSVGLHEANAATFQYSILPWALHRIPGLIQTTEFYHSTNTLTLPLGTNGDSVSGTIDLNPDCLRWGSASECRSAHRCRATPDDPYCEDCGHYIPVDLCLLVSKDLLTLKHDNQTTISISHTNSPGETLDAGVVEIRYKNGNGEWWELGSETNLQPWTARFPGSFELRGKIASGGDEWMTPVRDLTVQFPSVDDIRFDPSVIQRAELEWRATLDDCSTNWGWTRERGYWIALDTQTSSYAAMNPTNGGWGTGNEIDSVYLGNRPPNLWSDPDNHQAGAIYVVASFHTHPPTSSWPTGGEPGRPVGPSEDSDIPAAAAGQLPGLVFDYEADTIFSENYHTNGIPAGWPTNAPARIYPVTPPERRPLP